MALNLKKHNINRIARTAAATTKIVGSVLK